MSKKITIDAHYECKFVYSELNKIIKRILKIHNDVKCDSAGKIEPGYVAYPFHVLKELDSLKLVLFNILYEKTNIRKVIDEKKYYFSLNDLDKAIKNSDSKSKTPIYQRFLLNLNEISDIKEESFSFIFPLNLTLDVKNDNEYFKNFLGKFKIKRIDITDVKKILNTVNTKNTDKVNSNPDLNHIKQQFQSLNKKNELSKEDVINYLNDYPLILLVDVEARNLAYAERFAGFFVKSFIGSLSFSENYLNEHSIPFFKFLQDISFNKIKFDEVVVLNQNKILWPKKNTITKLENKNEERSLIEFQGMSNLESICHETQYISEDLWEILIESFSLYNKASSEKSIEYSFLNFWIIAERLIKGGGAKNDDKVKSIMKSMVNDKTLKKRIDYLYKKRNGLVHKGETITEVSDRDLIKIVVDLILADAIRMMEKFKNKKQFYYYLSNIKTKKEDRANYLEVLNMLNQMDNEE